MRKSLLREVLAAVSLVAVAGLPAAAAVEVGAAAPAFEAESTAGTIRLADYAGKKHVVLAFYFKDFTGG